MKKVVSIGALALILAGVTAFATDTEFRVMDPLGRNTVQFKTTAPLEDIVGITSQIEGYIRVDPEQLRTGPTGALLTVDLESLETGISLRDRHMREQYLHTDQHPKAALTLQRVKKAADARLTPGKPSRVVIEGSFTLHGIERKIEVPATVTYMPQSEATMSKLPGNLLRVQAEFDVRLADFKIERPQMVFMKVGEVARITVDVFATDATAEQMDMWMEQMKKMMSE